MHLTATLLSTLTLLLLTPLTLADPSISIETTSPVPSCAHRTANGDTISVHYRGRLGPPSDKEFDASYNRGQPLTFELGKGRVIKGWEQGLLDMCPGEKRTLTIPPELGYGQRAMGPIPAGSTLVFETELVGIQGHDEL